MKTSRSWCVAVICCCASLAMPAQQESELSNSYVNSQLPWHNVTLDSERKLVSWYRADENLGFDKVVHLAWDFLEHKVKTDPGTGQKIFLINSTFDPTTGLGSNWQGNPASTFGQFVDSVVAWYPYSGDQEAIAVVRSMLDYQLAHGITPADWEWAKVPFPTGCGNDPEYGKCLRGEPKDFYGGIETDKVGELGIGFVLFYEMTGDKKYLQAGIKCADALAKHIRSGDETHTPWAFRVNAKDGQVINGEEYGGMIVAPVRLLSELMRLKQGNIPAYEESRDLAWKWILKYPMQNDRWSGYFEDVEKNVENVNQASPTMTAYYILSQSDPASVDSQWIGHVGHVIDWVRKHFGRGPYFGAWAIDEQGLPPEFSLCCSRAGLASDTSRWAAINALYYAKTGDGQAQVDAFRSLSYSTYFTADDGKVACCGLDYNAFGNLYTFWFDDGYGDYIRNIMWAMGAIPVLAPKHQDHLLHSSSVVQSVQYGGRSTLYRTFDVDATEVLRLSYRPKEIKSGAVAIQTRPDLNEQGYMLTRLPDGDYILRLRHRDSADVQIKG